MLAATKLDAGVCGNASGGGVPGFGADGPFDGGKVAGPKGDGGKGCWAEALAERVGAPDADEVPREAELAEEVLLVFDVLVPCADPCGAFSPGDDAVVGDAPFSGTVPLARLEPVVLCVEGFGVAVLLVAGAPLAGLGPAALWAEGFGVAVPPVAGELPFAFDVTGTPEFGAGLLVEVADG